MISWNFDGHRILSESWSGSTRFRVLNKRPPQGYSCVAGRLTNTQVTSRPGRCDRKYGCVCPHVLKREQSSSRILINPKYKLHVRRRKFTIFFPPKLNNLTSSLRKPEGGLIFQQKQQCHASHKCASPPLRHQGRKLQCQKDGGGDPWH